ncbi:MAG: type II toxin-antitoxin system RelE/ParE family toxin [Planctomycetaceae bacterium]|nr:type II toxin-antitoxin system RelE/ParE family toxin [Planctomycetaceae bacterium]
MRIIVLPRAEADIVESAQFIAEDSLDSALRFMDQAQVAFNFLRQFPEAGSDHVYSSDTLRGTRSWPIRGFENWIVFYVVRDNELIVIRVLHGARDV